MKRDTETTRTGAGALEDTVHESPVDRHQTSFRKRWLLATLVLVVGIAVVWLLWRFGSDRPVTFAAIDDHFKYGSIGAEPGGSLTNPLGGVLPPYWVFRALPEICPDRLPGGYESIGLLYEDGRDLPIGVSRRWRLGFDQVGMNCAFCHTGTVRETPDSSPVLVLGMPAHQLDIQEFFRFVLDCSLDPRLTGDNLVGTIGEMGGDLGTFDRFLYQTALVPQVKSTVLGLQQRIAPLMGDDVTPWGHGRVDTFNPYKSIQFNWHLDQLPHDELIGASDFPSLWNQEPREGMWLHWDGNNSSVDERNLSASLGAGVTPVTIDHDELQRVADWAWTLPPPEYPFAIDRAEAERGREIYARLCTDCHADARFRDGHVAGNRVGQVVPLDAVGTDPYRLHTYTYEFASNQYALYPDSRYQFRHFRKTEGYANHPLDGIWARAPYLHNGSVPTLRALLDRPEERPVRFYRGYDVYDQDDLGFVHDVPAAEGRRFTLHDTSLPGNSNSGHLWGTSLSPEDKDALVEYMKTF